MKNIWWAKSGDVDATNERFLEFVLELCKNGLPITMRKIQKEAMEAATSLKIAQQDFKASDGEAVRFTHHIGL